MPVLLLHLAVDPDFLGDIGGGIMVTRERIRFLLIHHKTIRSNIRKAREIAIEMESDSDVIEARVMSATDYARDKIQTGGESNALTMSSVRRERFEQRNDVSMRNFIINAQEAEIEHLDCAVFNLPPVSQKIIILRFYDCLSKREIEEREFYSQTSIKRITRKAVRELEDIFNGHKLRSIETDYNNLTGESEEDMIQKEYGKFIPTCEVCGEELVEEDNFDAAVSAIKEAGWKIVKENGGFSAYCPNCQ